MRFYGRSAIDYPFFITSSPRNVVQILMKKGGLKGWNYDIPKSGICNG
jgi:hypothetical protein